MIWGYKLHQDPCEITAVAIDMTFTIAKGTFIEYITLSRDDDNEQLEIGKSRGN